MNCVTSPLIIKSLVSRHTKPPADDRVAESDGPGLSHGEVGWTSNRRGASDGSNAGPNEVRERESATGAEIPSVSRLPRPEVGQAADAELDHRRDDDTDHAGGNERPEADGRQLRREDEK